MSPGSLSQSQQRKKRNRILVLSAYVLGLLSSGWALLNLLVQSASSSPPLLPILHFSASAMGSLLDLAGLQHPTHSLSWIASSLTLPALALHLLLLYGPHLAVASAVLAPLSLVTIGWAAHGGLLHCQLPKLLSLSNALTLSVLFLTSLPWTNRPLLLAVTGVLMSHYLPRSRYVAADETVLKQFDLMSLGTSFANFLLMLAGFHSFVLVKWTSAMDKVEFGKEIALVQGALLSLGGNRVSSSHSSLNCVLQETARLVFPSQISPPNLRLQQRRLLRTILHCTPALQQSLALPRTQDERGHLQSLLPPISSPSLVASLLFNFSLGPVLEQELAVEPALSPSLVSFLSEAKAPEDQGNLFYLAAFLIAPYCRSAQPIPAELKRFLSWERAGKGHLVASYLYDIEALLFQPFISELGCPCGEEEKDSLQFLQEGLERVLQDISVEEKIGWLEEPVSWFLHPEIFPEEEGEVNLQRELRHRMNVCQNLTCCLLSYKTLFPSAEGPRFPKDSLTRLSQALKIHGSQVQPIPAELKRFLSWERAGKGLLVASYLYDIEALLFQPFISELGCSCGEEEKASLQFLQEGLERVLQDISVEEKIGWLEEPVSWFLLPETFPEEEGEANLQRELRHRMNAFLEIFRRSSHRQHLLKHFLCSGHASGDNRSPFAPADDTELQEFRIAVQEFQNQIVSSDTIMDPKVLDLCLMDPEYLLRSLLHSCLRNGARAVPQTLDVLKEQCQYHEVPSFCRLAVKFVAEFLRQLVSAEMVRPPSIPLTVTSLATLLSQDAGDLIAREELLIAGILPLWKGNPSTSVLRLMQTTIEGAPPEAIPLCRLLPLLLVLSSALQRHSAFRGADDYAMVDAVLGLLQTAKEYPPLRDHLQEQPTPKVLRLIQSRYPVAYGSLKSSSETKLLLLASQLPFLPPAQWRQRLASVSDSLTTILRGLLSLWQHTPSLTASLWTNVTLGTLSLLASQQLGSGDVSASSLSATSLISVAKMFPVDLQVKFLSLVKMSLSQSRLPTEEEKRTLLAHLALLSNRDMLLGLKESFMGCPIGGSEEV
ncbi:unnamed protein product [Cyprideis torosa]|uniref:Uncharacterized protein n=1 Tax=Cyprideis torosa TaxID=163714 RepID=A0A7R8ZM88_9CRUS|nr:unnamed protein product [Cyprideis torosa]CAG0883783.1 unnamed protein product [Cyprideis torosa]